MERIQNRPEIFLNYASMREVVECAESMIGKMKEKIDSGFYDLLISDEIKGRIPTLIFRKIYQARNPKKEFGTLFINGGKFGEEVNKEEYRHGIEEVLQKYGSKEKILLITEVISSGESIGKMAGIIKNTGAVSDIDIATLARLHNMDDIDDDELIPMYSNPYGESFVGAEKFRDLGIDLMTREFGVKKSLDSVTHPVLVTVDDFEFYEEPERELSDQVRMLREDIDTIANHILYKVWGK